MNAMVPQTATLRALPAGFVPPKLSVALWGLLRDVRQGYRVPVAAALRAEARAVLPAFERAIAPAGVDHVTQWLLDVNMAMGAPIEQDEFEARAPMVADALADLPACAFTVDTRREAALTFEYFPGAAAIGALLGERVRELRGLVEAMRRVIEAPLPDLPRRRPTAREIEAVGAAAAAHHAAVAERLAADTVPAVPAVSGALADARLLEVYEAIQAGPDASPAVALRLAALRLRLSNQPAAPLELPSRRRKARKTKAK